MIMQIILIAECDFKPWYVLNGAYYQELIVESPLFITDYKIIMPKIFQLVFGCIFINFRHLYCIIKMSGSESWPRKIELTCMHKNATTTMSILHITTKLVNIPTKQPYHIDIFIS